MMNGILNAEGIFKSYGEQEVLKNLSTVLCTCLMRGVFSAGFVSEENSITYLFPLRMRV